MGSYEEGNNRLTREPIAIVGSSCRFPGGATSPSKLWDLLQKPEDVLQEIPASRFNTEAFHHSNSQHHGSMNVKHAYLLDEDPRAFDRDFFSITPKEAEAMDPQQRMLLETVYEGVESTGYSMQQLRGTSTAVFVGCMSYDYHFTAIRGIDSLPQYNATGTAASILANRVSYFYDWRGPSVTIDTACSSSLVALHQAVSTLRNGETEMAVVAGSNLILGPEPFVSESKLNMLSPNGRSYMWDASADGYTRGEGFCTLFLKKLSQAIADGDAIECIVRETGVNSDGKTPGITMPGWESQARLIRETYARCGLDPTRESDRPQYFEAHGTGTPAGDPIEARAIQSVFFPDEEDGQLMVGSIKTVIGHTEGTAGVAGVLKAALAVQHGQIPANLHFNQLNPKILPYYTNLRVPTETVPWPSAVQGSPRRVSVNSFGFGGTNAHAIIESWEGPHSCTNGHVLNGHTMNGNSVNGEKLNGTTVNGDSEKKGAVNGHTVNGNTANGHDSTTLPAGPFVLSANSGTALAATAEALACYIRAHPATDLSQLAFTLFKKTDFPFRAAFSATSAEQLIQKLEAGKDSLKSNTRTATIPEVLPVRILGVFTGQGAQWATMGKELYTASSLFRSALNHMQQSLNSLPADDRPDWSLVDQLYAPENASRLSEAVVSQPLCTALQVALVDVLRAAGIELSAVVGHSSGEIGAAYAAGYLSATDAIRIAYYRGVHSHLAQGPGGKRGKMMAVGMSLAEATAFCREFDGALGVAASNSETSCTVAGDAEAVENAYAQLQEKGIFARVLLVDTAYHSHHMTACAGPYLESLKQCMITVRKPRRQCQWYSSVWGSKGRGGSFERGDSSFLDGQYWVDNMVHSVLFSEALARALNEDQYFDLALEVGPHPALKGPSNETIKTLTGISLPYSGVLKRGQNAVESFCDTLGLLWKLFPSSKPLVTFDRVQRAFTTGKSSKLSILKDIPTYSWDHPNLIWKESRSSRVFRTHSRPRHELLGHSVTHGERDKREMHWKQLLKLSELPWLDGHKIQGDVLFPASGYLSMTYEAAIQLVLLEDQRPLRLVELHDIDIVRAMRLEEDSSGLEVVFTVRVTNQTEDCLTADVSCYSGAVDSVQPLDAVQAGLTAHFTGSVRIWFGQPDKDNLPRRSEPLLPMDSLNMGQLYSCLAKEGLLYTGHFQAKSMQRRLNRAVITVSSPPEPTLIRTSMHPAPVDAAFQGLLAAFSYPGDGRIGTIYLPTRVECVRISMTPESSLEILDRKMPSVSDQDSVLTADATVISTTRNSIVGNVDLFDAKDAHTEVQIRGIHLTAVGERRDPWLYASTEWMRDADYGIERGLGAKFSEADLVTYERLSRTAYFYLRQLKKKILPQELLLMGKYRKHMMTWVTKHLLPQVDAGEHPDIKPEWNNDTREMIEQWRTEYPSDNNDMNILHAMGKNLVTIVRGTTPPLRVLTQDGMLDRLYVEGLGFKEGNHDLAIMVKQLAHQHPRMRIIEVGAGTGGTTRAVLGALENQYASYTYTDISTGFFENARKVFRQHSSKLTFKTLNIEFDPVELGYVEGSYDLVVSANCLHATKNLGETLRHCRKLLRPGGRLLLLEVTRDFLPTQLCMSTLPGWFMGVEDGRIWAPTVNLERWDELLKANGFSGVDVSSTPSFCSIIVAQAVDETVQLLREPLAVSEKALPPCGDIVIVGSDTSSSLVSKTQELLRASVPSKTVTTVPSLEDIEIPKGAVVLCLSDLNQPVFHDMDEKRFNGLRDVMDMAEAVLWVTTGAKSGDDPEANITLGLSSTLRMERMDLRLQYLDVDDPSTVDPAMLAKMLLRLAFLNPSQSDGPLWIQEPELVFKKGAFYIPRVRSRDTVNRRSAAGRRQITQTVNLDSRDTAIVLNEHQGHFDLQTASLRISRGKDLRVSVRASSLRTFTCSGNGPFYVCIGRDLASGDMVLALSEGNSSLIGVAEDHVLCRWENNNTAAGDPANLQLFLARALGQHLVDDLEGLTWIHGAPADLNDAIAAFAREQDKNVFLTTSEMPRVSEVKFIHPYANEEDLQDICPKGLQTFIKVGRAQHKTLSAFIGASLPASAIVYKKLEDLTIGSDLLQLRSLAKQHFQGDSPIPTARSGIVSIDEAPTVASKEQRLTAVLDWSTVDSVNALVRPLRQRGLFASKKTYLLCGMTGDLGISVCLWMVENGARHIVLTSRKPNVPAGVLDYLSRKGATVRAVSVDVSNMDSLSAAYTDIKASMPPIGGVMNAAMVLRDHLFSQLSWEDVAAVLAPKVAGSKNLNEILKHEQLEFFICFGSSTAIIGSVGQSAYAAANYYMASLVEQRRQRGLPGSIVHIGVLTGFGYIFRRASEDVETILKFMRPRFDRQSESDLHEMLAEAIVCGRPDSNEPTELITGIKTNFEGEWREDPRLSAYTGQQQLEDDLGSEQTAGSVPVKEQLNAAEEPAECLGILEKCFALSLGNLLEMDPEKVDRNLPVASLGIDSLVAIRIREWFLRELGVDVPVLKLMSDTYPMSRMCDDVLVDWRRITKVAKPE